MNYEPEHWTGHWRDDGASVAVQADESWIVISGDERPALRLCPCCGKAFASPSAAMVVADAMYPLAKTR